MSKNKERELESPAIYKHFKGKEYAVVDLSSPINKDKITTENKVVLAEHTETKRIIEVFVDEEGKFTHREEDSKEELVLYIAMYNCKIYLRPKDMFLSEVDKEKYPKASQKYRFETKRGCRCEENGCNK